MSELNNSAEMIAMQAQIFDDVRPSGTKLFLLKRRENSSKFSVVTEITSGWNTVFDKEFRDEMKVSIATASNIADQIGQSSFLAYGIGGSGQEIDVFSFEKKDSFPPSATSPSWKIHCRREPAERFTIP